MSIILLRIFLIDVKEERGAAIGQSDMVSNVGQTNFNFRSLRCNDAKVYFLVVFQFFFPLSFGDFALKNSLFLNTRSAFVTDYEQLFHFRGGNDAVRGAV